MKRVGSSSELSQKSELSPKPKKKKLKESSTSGDEDVNPFSFLDNLKSNAKRGYQRLDTIEKKKEEQRQKKQKKVERQRFDNLGFSSPSSAKDDGDDFNFGEGEEEEEGSSEEDDEFLSAWRDQVQDMYDDDDVEKTADDDYDAYLVSKMEAMSNEDDFEDTRTDTKGEADSKSFPFPKEWGRPDAPSVEDGESLFFQHVHTSYTSKGKWHEKYPVIQFWGVTSNENSVLVEVDDFRPYLWCDPGEDNFVDIRALARNLNEAIEKVLVAKSRGKWGHWLQRNDKSYIVSIEKHQKNSILGWTPDGTKEFLKITAAMPKLIPMIRNLLEEGEVVGKDGRFNLMNAHLPGGMMCYESKLPFDLRYMVDKRLAGNQWMRVHNIKNQTGKKKTSRCQYDVQVTSEDVVPVFLEAPPEDDPIWNDLKLKYDPDVETCDETAPVRIMSFDIECAGRRGHFPDPEIDPVIQICCWVKVMGEDKPRFGVAFSFKQCKAIDGVQVYSFNTELKMLKAFADFVRLVDFEISTGYNIDNFDWNYLIKRSEALNLGSDFLDMGRIKGNKVWLNKTSMTSKAYGTKEAVEARIDGRFSLDVMRYIQREFKFRSYSLNAMSAEFLNDSKLDIHHTKITPLWNGTIDERTHLLSYCVKDALLPLHLWDHLMIGFGYSEMSRVTGVPMGVLLSRGQQIKVLTLLTREANILGYLLPSFLKRPKESFPGAVVLEPIKGYHTNPIVTLDFASLYPSIIIAENLGYCTWARREYAEQYLFPDDYNTVPDNPDVVFVKEHIRESVLAMIEKRLLARRSIAKKDMNAAEERGDKARHVIFNARQLALKIVANSGYGFTGAHNLPLYDIPKAVTANGRLMIQSTKKKVEEHFCKANGYEYDSRVVYGDTDSVFVDFGPVSKERANQLGNEASKLCKKLFRKPHDLENESIYCPLLLMKKKRYCALMWEAPRQWRDMPFEEWRWDLVPNDKKNGVWNGYSKIQKKGMENVRRDNARIVGETLTACIKKLMVDRDPESAIKHVHQVTEDLIMGRTEFWDLIISEGISKSFESYEESGARRKAVELAKRWQKRDPATAPKVGDRVPFVIVNVMGTKDKKKTSGSTAMSLIVKRKNGNPVPSIQDIADKTEDPIYAMRNGIPILVSYYLWNQLMRPLLKLFSPVVASNEDIDLMVNGMSSKDVEKKFGSYDGTRNGYDDLITDWIKKGFITDGPPKKRTIPKCFWKSAAFEALFGLYLPHMNKRKKTVPKNSGMFKYSVALPKCLGCKTPIRNAKDGGKDTPLCSSCETKREEHYGVVLDAAKKSIANRESKLKTCRDCLGPGEDIFLCSNKDCGNLYAREKALMDMEDACGLLSRFTKEEEARKSRPKRKIKLSDLTKKKRKRAKK